MDDCVGPNWRTEADDRSQWEQPGQEHDGAMLVGRGLLHPGDRFECDGVDGAEHRETHLDLRSWFLAAGVACGVAEGEVEGCLAAGGKRPLARRHDQAERARRRRDREVEAAAGEGGP